MSNLSTFRLFLLRAMYVFMFVGLALFKLPRIFTPPEQLSTMGSVVLSVLGGIALLAALGIRYPVKMLPLLLFELLWKVIWVLAFGLPLWYTQRLAADARDVLINCLVGIVLVPLVMPWSYVFRQYLKVPGDLWGKQVSVNTPPSGPRDPSRT